MESLNFAEAWLTSISYTLQLYFDFSGYCDMAMGIGMMFNIILPINFNSPYKSTNIQEFWRKWHITLGRFMTNYLYIPLGGNRKGEIKTLRNLFIVFLASGIWHGAGWNFVIWGMLHGLCILVHRIWKNTGRKLPKLIGWFITINLVNIFWVFFRARDIQSALKVLRGMVNIATITDGISRVYKKLDSSAYREGLKFLIIAVILTFLLKNTYEKIKKFKAERKYSIETISYLIFSIMSLTSVSTFLYFNF